MGIPSTRQQQPDRSAVATTAAERRKPPARAGRALGLLSLLALLLLPGCGAESMADQPKVDPLEPVIFDAAGPVLLSPARTVPRDAAAVPSWVETGRQDGELVTTMPLSVTAELLARGQEQYNIFCTPCHGFAGFGEGIMVQRGFPHPPSFHTIRLREAPDGHFFDVISNGSGPMYAYGPQLAPADRWAVIAYIRALQLSQHAPAELLAPAEREMLDEEATE